MAGLGPRGVWTVLAFRCTLPRSGQRLVGGRYAGGAGLQRKLAVPLVWVCVPSKKL